MWIAIVVLLQAVSQPIAIEEIALYNKILDESAPAARLKLLQEFEQKYPNSKNIGEMFGLTMEVYRAQNNVAKTLQYGEKALKADPQNLQALTIIARQYAIEGRNLDRAVEYAKRAKDVIAKKKVSPKPAGILQPQWNSYLQQLDASADWTLNYVQSITTSVLKRRP